MNLADILTGRSLDIPVERLDLQGLAAAIRAYNNASPEEQIQLEIGLASTIQSTDDWSLIVDAVYLARSLRMSHQMLMDAIDNISDRVVPEQYSVSMSTEARRYRRDIIVALQEAAVTKLRASPKGLSESEDNQLEFSLLSIVEALTHRALEEYIKSEPLLGTYQHAIAHSITSRMAAKKGEYANSEDLKKNFAYLFSLLFAAALVYERSGSGPDPKFVQLSYEETKALSDNLLVNADILAGRLLSPGFQGAEELVQSLMSRYIGP